MTPPPIACSLEADRLQERTAEWAAVVGDAVSRSAIEGGARLEFAPDASNAARLVDLAWREHECCPFFSFAVEIAAGRLALIVTAPADAAVLVEAIVGANVPASATLEG